MDKFLARILPFVFIGIAIAIGILFFTVMAYVMLIGMFFGLILYGIVFLRDKFFPNKFNKEQERDDKKIHRTFDYDDLK